MECNHMSSYVAATIALYLAYVDDQAIICYFLVFYDIRFLPNKIAYPIVDL